MTENPEPEKKPIPKGQRLFDSLVVLIVLSLIFTTLMYNVWAFIDLASIPRLP